MGDYIERDAVVALFEEKQKSICPLGRCSRNMVYGVDRDLYDAIDSDIDTVLSIPAADVVKVKRGSWEFVNDYESKCTNCKEDSFVDHSDEPNYCPKCGADMRGDKV